MSIMKYVVLIRHGESYTNRNGILSSELNKYRLTEEGLEQARFTGEQLKGLKFNGIISSPVLRAVETANIINQFLNLHITTDNRALESDFGEYNGKRIVDIPDKSRNELGMESFESLKKNYDSEYGGFGSAPKFPSFQHIIIPENHGCY